MRTERWPLAVSHVPGNRPPRAAIELWRGEQHLRSFSVQPGSFAGGLWFAGGDAIATIGWDERGYLYDLNGRPLEWRPPTSRTRPDEALRLGAGERPGVRRLPRRRVGGPGARRPALFELLTLEGAQAGLSWLTILRKRDGYRARSTTSTWRRSRATREEGREAARRSGDRAQPAEGGVDREQCAARPRARRSVAQSSSGRSSTASRSSTAGRRRARSRRRRLSRRRCRRS